MKKILYIGCLDPHDGRDGKADLFCKAEVTEGRLSISGVIGPLRSGNARGGCGQIDGEFKHAYSKYDDKRYNPESLIKAEDIDYAEGWNEGKWLQFLDIWHRWHLNDMRAECEHQRDLGWNDLAQQKITLFFWTLKPEILEKQKQLKEEAEELIKNTGRHYLNRADRKIYGLEWMITTVCHELKAGDARFYEPGTGYKGTHEEKTRGWLDYTKYPEVGILSKPCPVCGYKYGTDWKYEELPAEVVEFISDLPDASKDPAWI